MHRLTMAAVAVLLTACGGTSSTVIETVAPTSAPTVAQPDADKVVALVRDNIAELYATDPQPDWYSALHMVNGKPDIAYDDGWIYAVSLSSDPAVGESMCHDLAMAAYDANGKAIGFRDVLIYGPGQDDLADCDVPER